MQLHPSMYSRTLVFVGAIAVASVAGCADPAEDPGGSPAGGAGAIGAGAGGAGGSLECQGDGTDSQGRCSTACGADEACDGVLPGGMLTSCAAAGNAAIQDRCDASCWAVDEPGGMCRAADPSDCAGALACDGVVAGTLHCDAECQDERPYFLRVSRAIGNGAHQEVFFESPRPHSLLGLELRRDVELGWPDPCTNALPGSAQITTLDADASDGSLEYEVTGLADRFTPATTKKACIVTLFGDLQRCEGIGREYGVAIWIEIFNENWGDDWCAQGQGHEDECNERLGYHDTMKLEAWDDRAGDLNCDVVPDDPQGVQHYDHYQPWSASETYRLLVEFN